MKKELMNCEKINMRLFIRFLNVVKIIYVQLMITIAIRYTRFIHDIKLIF